MGLCCSFHLGKLTLYSVSGGRRLAGQGNFNHDLWMKASPDISACAVRLGDTELHNKTLETMEALLSASPREVAHLLEGAGASAELSELTKRTMQRADSPENEGISVRNDWFILFLCLLNQSVTSFCDDLLFDCLALIQEFEELMILQQLTSAHV